MKVTILYRNMKFEFETKEEAAWYDLDHAFSTHKDYQMSINADREVYADLTSPGKTIQGYITDDEEKDSLPDNALVEEKEYHFVRLKKPGFYL